MTPWTIARQAPLSMAFPRQEYWNGLSFSIPGDLPEPGIEPASPACRQVLYRWATGEAHLLYSTHVYYIANGLPLIYICVCVYIKNGLGKIHKFIIVVLLQKKHQFYL